MTSSSSSRTSITVTHLGVSTLIIVACLILMVNAAKFGYSKVLGRYAGMTNSINVADEAVKLTPADPQAHQARAIVLYNLRRPTDAAKEMEMAVSLRPQDDYLWLELAGLREAAGNTDAALAAFDQAIAFAPYYGHTYWQRGNFLVRLGRYEEGFKDLRVAVSSNRDFLSALIDLAWGVSRGDARIVEQLVQVRDDKTRLVFARFLARHGKVTETLDQFRQISSPIAPEMRDDLIRSLIQHKAYSEAHEIWKRDRAGTWLVTNGGFESDLVLDHLGFDWQATKMSGVGLALDVNQPHSGTRSLRISFEGYENQERPVLSQMFLVHPDQKYRVQFAVRTRDLVTGGLPVVTVSDAATGQMMANSETIRASANEWINLSFDFHTLPASKAVSLNLQRNRCSSSPCPIFGQVWIDNVSVDEAGPK